jgi:hypothetical protein
MKVHYKIAEVISVLLINNISTEGNEPWGYTQV